jgi:hypothetical protein
MVAAQRPDVRFLIVGHGPDRAASERLAARLGLADRLTLAGLVPSVPRALNDASMLVMSSRSEGFGYVALEAALQARATVAPRVEGLVDAIAHGESGLLVEPSSSALAEGILTLLGGPGLLSAMGANARRGLAASASHLVDRYLALYEQPVAIGRVGSLTAPLVFASSFAPYAGGYDVQYAVSAAPVPTDHECLVVTSHPSAVAHGRIDGVRQCPCASARQSRSSSKSLRCEVRADCCHITRWPT